MSQVRDRNEEGRHHLNCKQIWRRLQIREEVLGALITTLSLITSRKKLKMAKHPRRGCRGDPSGGDRPASPDGGGKGSARGEPAGSKNFARSNPPRAGPKETRAKEDGANSVPAAPTWRRPGSRRSAGRSPASPPLPLPCPGKGSAERRTGRSCARGRCPSCGRRTCPPRRRAAPSAGPDEAVAGARVAAALACRVQPESARAASAAPPARPARALPVRLLLPPATRAARPPGGASHRHRHRPAARRRQPTSPGGAAWGSCFSQHLAPLALRAITVNANALPPLPC